MKKLSYLFALTSLACFFLSASVSAQSAVTNSDNKQVVKPTTTKEVQQNTIPCTKVGETGTTNTNTTKCSHSTQSAEPKSSGCAKTCSKAQQSKCNTPCGSAKKEEINLKVVVPKQ